MKIRFEPFFNTFLKRVLISAKQNVVAAGSADLSLEFFFLKCASKEFLEKHKDITNIFFFQAS